MTYQKKCANPECDTVFETKYPQQKFCIKCGFTSYGRYKPHPRLKVKKICPICGCEFFAPKGATRLGTQFQRFCSPECQSKASQQRKVEFDSRWSDGSPVR